MLDIHAKSRRRFTQAARDAALAKRRELAALPKDPAGSLQVFVVRGAGQSNAFCWEIRRFGAIVVERSVGGFADGQTARDAGEDTLQRSFRN